MTEDATVTAGLFDAHLHIIDPVYPLVENDGYLPDPFTVEDYRAAVEGFEVQAGAVVSGSFQAFDQSYLVDALDRLGPTYVGVTQVPADISDHEVRRLDAAGVRAVRFNVRRGGSADMRDMDRLARRVYDIAGWHSEFYIDGRQLPDLGPRITALPAACIDHLGMHEDGLLDLLVLVERGVKVKATGFGRVDLDPGKAIRRIMAVDPGALMVGTDLPSTRARRPFRATDLGIVRDAVQPEHAAAVFWDNAAALYLARPRIR